MYRRFVEHAIDTLIEFLDGRKTVAPQYRLRPCTGCMLSILQHISIHTYQKVLTSISKGFKTTKRMWQGRGTLNSQFRQHFDHNCLYF